MCANGLPGPAHVWLGRSDPGGHQKVKQNERFNTRVQQLSVHPCRSARKELVKTDGSLSMVKCRDVEAKIPR